MREPVAAYSVLTTAPSSASSSLVSYLERQYDCKIVGISHNLARRPQLGGPILITNEVSKP